MPDEIEAKKSKRYGDENEKEKVEGCLVCIRKLKFLIGLDVTGDDGFTVFNSRFINHVLVSNSIPTNCSSTRYRSSQRLSFEI
jgi:hypothetical protein